MSLDRNLDHLGPEMRKAVLLLLNDLKYEKICTFLNEGFRPHQRQAALYAQGRTTPGPIVTKAKPGHSYHAFGLAIDLYPCNKDGDPVWNFDPTQAPWPRVVQLAKMRGLRWGGDWKGGFKDYPHLELASAPALWLLRLRYPKGWTPAKGSK